MLECVRLEPEGREPRASVIWMHGLGADGHDFVPIVQALTLPPERTPRFIFPHAPVRPVTINMGMAMRAWYDIAGLDGSFSEDADGILASAREIDALIEAEYAAGIPRGQVVLAGFSQGGAMALHTGLRRAERLLGVMALSTYLPLHKRFADEASAANREVPILQCHGTQDPMVPVTIGQFSRDHLRGLGYAVDWKDYPMQHEVCPQQVADIREWLLGVLP